MIDHTELSLATVRMVALRSEVVATTKRKLTRSQSKAELGMKVVKGPKKKTAAYKRQGPRKVKSFQRKLGRSCG